MQNTKKEIRERLQQLKRLKKELRELPKDSMRAIEIRKELGIATLKDILDKYPIRVCRHCGKRAYTIDDLWEFRYNPSSRYNHDNLCMDCKKLLNIDPKVNIVGRHCILEYKKSCPECGRANTSSHIGERSWFHPRAVLCKCCVGSHTDILGFPVRLSYQIRVTYRGVEYTSIAKLAKALGLPYIKTRNILFQNKLKDYNG